MYVRACISVRPEGRGCDPSSVQLGVALPHRGSLVTPLNQGLFLSQLPKVLDCTGGMGRQAAGPTFAHTCKRFAALAVASACSITLLEETDLSTNADVFVQTLTLP